MREGESCEWRGCRPSLHPFPSASTFLFVLIPGGNEPVLWFNLQHHFVQWLQPILKPKGNYKQYKSSEPAFYTDVVKSNSKYWGLTFLGMIIIIINKTVCVIKERTCGQGHGCLGKGMIWKVCNQRLRQSVYNMTTNLPHCDARPRPPCIAVWSEWHVHATEDGICKIEDGVCLCVCMCVMGTFNGKKK